MGAPGWCFAHGGLSGCVETMKRVIMRATRASPSGFPTRLASPSRGIHAIAPHP